MQSPDIIESGKGGFYIFDVTMTFNFSADNVEIFGFNPVWLIVEHNIARYKKYE